MRTLLIDKKGRTVLFYSPELDKYIFKQSDLGLINKIIAEAINSDDMAIHTFGIMLYKKLK